MIAQGDDGGTERRNESAPADQHDRKAAARIIHAAGLLDDAMIVSTTLFSFSARCAQGAREHPFDRLSRSLPIDFCTVRVCCWASGSPGQANYAAANSFLGALARIAVPRDFPLCIDWGPYSQAGLAAAHRDRAERLALRGNAESPSR